MFFQCNRFYFVNLSLVLFVLSLISNVDSANCQDFGIPIWGRSYQDSSVATPSATPAPLGTPISETRLPIKVHAVNTSYTVTKEMNTVINQEKVLSSLDKQINYITRTVGLGASSFNFFQLTKFNGTRNPETGRKLISSKSGMCQESLAFQTNSCSTSVSNFEASSSESSVPTNYIFESWSPSEIKSRPYICSVNQYVDASGQEFKYANTYREENRISIFVDGQQNYNYKVRFNLDVSTVVPQIDYLFFQTNIYGLMSPYAVTPIAPSNIRLENFSLVSGTTNTFEGVVRGITAHPIILSDVPTKLIRSSTTSRPKASHSCIFYTISNPRVIQNLGD
jgi:hypothetical protein